MQNKWAIGASALALILIVGIGTAGAATGDGEGRFKRFHKSEKSPEMIALHEAVKDAFDSGNYTAFQTAVADSEFAEKKDIDEATFNVLVEAKGLKQAGDVEGAKALFEEAGLEGKFHKGMKGHHFNKDHGGIHQALKEAIEIKDFTAFQTLTSDIPMLSEIDTLEEFELLIEAKELKEAGDREGAREIFEKLGFDKMGHKGSWKK